MKKQRFHVFVILPLLLLSLQVRSQITFQKIGESSNLFTALRSSDHPLSATESGQITFIHRQNIQLHGGSTIENGRYRYAISVDSAQTWITELGPINPTYSRVSRYPNVTFSVLPGDSHPSILYAGGTLNTGYPVVSGWTGIVSGIIPTPSLTSGVSATELYGLNDFSDLNISPPSSLTCSQPGTFWMTGREDSTLMIFRGTYQPGDSSLFWEEVKRFQPTVSLSGGQIAFDQTGQTGYMSVAGDLLNGDDGTLQPLYSISKNGGQTWSELQELPLSLFPQIEEKAGGKLSIGGNMDLLVDQNGVAHMFAMVAKADENYALFTREGEMTLIDFTLTFDGIWEGLYIADVHTFNAPILTSIGNQDNWLNISEDSEGVLYYHWTDSDTLAPGFPVTSGNSQPNLMGRAVNPTTGVCSPIKDWTSGVLNWSGNTSFIHTVSYFDRDAFDHVPMVAPDLSNYQNGLDPVSFYYLSGITYDSLTVQSTRYYSCQIEAITLNTKVTQASCANENGSLELTAIPLERGPFTYLWDTGDSTSLISNKAAGIYEVTLGDQIGCEFQIPFMLPDSGKVTLIDSVRPVSCDQENNGSISIAVQNGVSPYWISWSNGESTLKNRGLAPGSYSLVVSDLRGCQGLGIYHVNELAPLSVRSIVSEPTCAGLLNGSISLEPSGGSEPYTIQWAHGPTSTSISGIGPGCYDVVVTDSTGCSYQESFILNGTLPLELNLSSNPNSTCSFPYNGFATVSSSGGTDPVSFVWSGPGGFTNNQNISFGLNTGIYQVTATDANGCQATSSINVASTSNVNASVTFQQPTCSLPQVTVNTTVFSGSWPFTYEWMDGSTGSSLPNVSPGPFWVVITDALGCSYAYLDTIPSRADLVYDATTIVSPVCGDSSGSISINLAAAGLTGATLTWPSGVTGPSISNLGPGFYSLKVTESNGCSYLVDYDLSTGPPLEIISLTAGQVCSNAPLTTASVEVCGGVPPYQYQWSPGSNSNQSIPIGTGTYDVSISDQIGCTVQQQFSIQEFDPLESVAIKEIICHGGTGAILPILIDSDYSWNWTGTIAPLKRHQLLKGSYQLTIQNGSGCSWDTAFTLTEPPLLEANASSVLIPPDTTASLIALPSGGTPSYQYLWNYPSISSDSVVLVSSNGSYLLVVEDQKGCFDTTYVLVENINTVSNEAHIEDLFLRISPNPTSSVTTISWGEASVSGELFLYGIDGKKLLTKPFKRGNTSISIDMSSYPNGIYLIEWKTPSARSFRRIVRR